MVRVSSKNRSRAQAPYSSVASWKASAGGEFFALSTLLRWF